jgi:PhzF family phenazine biosynthesis protein
MHRRARHGEREQDEIAQKCSSSPGTPNRMTDIRRYAAFTTEQTGGNPAGVWIGESLPDPVEMQRIAAEVGYSETVFATRRETRVLDVRYFSPSMEVPFCGHATIALGVALGPAEDGGHPYRLDTPAGRVELGVTESSEGTVASLTSIEPTHRRAYPDLVTDAMGLLGWDVADLDDAIPPVIANAGVNHLVICVKARRTLERLNYDFDAMRALMTTHGLITLQLTWRQDSHVFQSRNPFPTGGIFEDPATGAAAAALGGYLRDAGILIAPTELTIHQGVDMGRPSRIVVTIPARGGIVVSGTAVELELQ